MNFYIRLCLGCIDVSFRYKMLKFCENFVKGDKFKYCYFEVFFFMRFIVLVKLLEEIKLGF